MDTTIETPEAVKTEKSGTDYVLVALAVTAGTLFVANVINSRRAKKAKLALVPVETPTK